jgi:aspartate/methionine/tyrosine aminotransferase
MKLSSQAETLNRLIKEQNPAVFAALSEKGRAIFFPNEGIMSQSAQAADTKLNATIGIAVEDDGSPMRLSAIEKRLPLPPKSIFPYAPSFGDAKLRSAWREHIRSSNPSLEGGVSTPVVACGITHALSVAAYLFVDEGDEIILPDLFWENYALLFEHAYGAKLSPFNTFTREAFDTASLKKALGKNGGRQPSFAKASEGSARKKILILNFPNNPTGYTAMQDEAEKILESIKEEAECGSNIVVICDDAYFGLVYEDGVYKESLFAKLATIHPNVVAVKADGATKEHFAWGFRVGFLTFGATGMDESGYRALEEKAAGAVRATVSNAPRPSQTLLLEALSDPSYDKEKAEKFGILKKRYEKVKEVLKNGEFQRYFSPLPFNSGYFMCVKLGTGLDAEKVRRALIENYGTGVIAFGNLLRIAYAGLPENRIEKLFDNIYRACEGAA